MTPTIKEQVHDALNQHNHLQLDNAEDRQLLVSAIAKVARELIDASYSNGYEDACNDREARGGW